MAFHPGPVEHVAYKIPSGYFGETIACEMDTPRLRKFEIAHERCYEATNSAVSLYNPTNTVQENGTCGSPRAKLVGCVPPTALLFVALAQRARLI